MMPKIEVFLHCEVKCIGHEFILQFIFSFLCKDHDWTGINDKLPVLWNIVFNIYDKILIIFC